MGRDRKRVIWGAAGFMAVCCTIHLIILAGGIGAAASLLGGWIGNPYVILAGLLLLTVALGALVISRTQERDTGSCCPPEPGTRSTARRDAERICG